MNKCVIRLGDKYHEKQVGRTAESSFSGAGGQEIEGNLLRIMWDGFLRRLKNEKQPTTQTAFQSVGGQGEHVQRS